jgi:hypothetical protein
MVTAMVTVVLRWYCMHRHPLTGGDRGTQKGSLNRLPLAFELDDGIKSRQLLPSEM